jgi:hypothetical protein
MRAATLAVDDAGLNPMKACGSEHLVQIGFSEAEPNIRIKIARLFKLMLQEVQHNDPPTGFQNAGGSPQSGLWILRVMQRLAKKSEVHARRLDWWMLEITETVFEICEPMALG